MSIDLTRRDPDEIAEYVVSMMGPEFEKVMAIAQDIIDDHSRYVGMQALTTAKKLAAYKLKWSVFEAYMKIKSAATKSAEDRLIKDSTITICHNIDEMINTLKLAGRVLDA